MARIRKRQRIRSPTYAMEWFFTADKRKRVHSIEVPPGCQFVSDRIGTISIVVINHGLFSTANLKFHGPHAMPAIAKIRRATVKS
jgi:hypothetical protein